MFPVLLLIVFGSLEYGLLFKDSLTGGNVLRAGGRALSAQANSNQADQAGIQAMIPAARFGGGLSRLNRIVVYFSTCTNPPVAYTNQATSRCPTGEQPIKLLSEMTGAGTGCIPKTALTGVAGRCNIYAGAQLTEAFANANGNWGCITTGTPSPDRHWCPADRIASQRAGTDYIGIHIEYTHEWVTGVFGQRKEMTDNVTFRVEPQGI